MEVRIRKGIKEDLVVVQKLSQELFNDEVHRDPFLSETWTYQKEGEEYFTKRLTQTEGICFVAEVNGEVVGYATASIMPIVSWRPVKRVEMDNLIVTANHRGKGIGEMLAKELFEWAKSQQMEKVTVSVYASNDGAIKFYTRIGFIPESLDLEISLSCI